jgi:hypothetical protein
MRFRKFQMGGEVAAPQEQPEQDPMAQLAQIAEQLIGQLGAEGAMQLAQMIMEMVQGGGEQPAEEMPAEEAPAPAFRKGGKMGKKMKYGSKMC